MAVKSSDFLGRDLLSVADLSGAEISFLLDRADRLKKERRQKRLRPSLQGKGVGLIFRKPSTRTRLSFEMGVYLLGGHPAVLDPAEMQLGRGETVEDTGRVLSRYLDAIMIRTFQQEEVRRLADGADIPVINGLTDLEHPCQVLADLQTVRERFGRLEGLKLAYLGDGNNVANSLLLGCALTGMHVSVACPPGSEPDVGIVRQARRLARGVSKVEVTADPRRAARGADALYTDVWVSMGQKKSSGYRKAMRPYQLNAELLSLARPGAVAMHCLPAHRGEEITDEVLDGESSAVWDQAENRMYAQMALLELLVG
jgi:ornithine carbamoyltransferase